MSRTRPFLTLAAPLAVTALVLAGCSGASDAAEPAATSAASAPAAANGNGGNAPGGGGTSGQIAQVGDATLQVRDDDGQTTVTWTDDTTFSATTAGTLADVTVGSCVTAITGAAPGATGATDGSTADSSGTAADAAATTVTITPATDGECTTGFGGRGGGTPGDRPSGAPTDMPTGAAGQPGDAPTGATGGRGGFGGFGGFTSGKVTAVDGSTLTVDATGQDGTTTSKTVTVDSSTTYSATAKASAKALVVGACATVQGKADDKGAVAATRIVVSQATDGTCSTGFGGGFGGRGQGGPAQGSQDDTSTRGSTDA